MEYSVIIVAGGEGLRMKSQIPKQFIEINNVPIIVHTINKFRKFDSNIEVIVSLNQDYTALWREIIKKFNLINIITVSGGKTRYNSVQNGINSLTKKGIVAIHDSVRPLVSIETITNCFEMAKQYGNAIPYYDLNESLRIENNRHFEIIDRNKIKTIQTPQVFNYTQLSNSYNKPYSELFTDDASVVEKSGFKLNFIKGNKENIKITEPIDLIIAKELL